MPLLPFLSVSCPSMSLVVFQLSILLSYFAHAKNQIFLVESKSTRSLGETSGEDYNMSVRKGYIYESYCQKDCIGGSYRKRRKRSWQKATEYNPYECYPRQGGTKAPPSTTAPVTNDCVRTPRDCRKIRRHAWGHWVLALRTSRNLCCSHGQKAGEMVSTPRCYKPRTPRTPRACN